LTIRLAASEFTLTRFRLSSISKKIGDEKAIKNQSIFSEKKRKNKKKLSTNIFTFLEFPYHQFLTLNVEISEKIRIFNFQSII
jgi:hypothetical protein